jgi:hypothetical protein
LFLVQSLSTFVKLKLSNAHPLLPPLDFLRIPAQSTIEIDSVPPPELHWTIGVRPWTTVLACRVRDSVVRFSPRRIVELPMEDEDLMMSVFDFGVEGDGFFFLRWRLLMMGLMLVVSSMGQWQVVGERMMREG